jgi:hypothetical protein
LRVSMAMRVQSATTTNRRKRVRFCDKCNLTIQPVEQERIEAAGGYIYGDRICGALALSRAFGDFDFKVTFFVLICTDLSLQIYPKSIKWLARVPKLAPGPFMKISNLSYLHATVRSQL